MTEIKTLKGNGKVFEFNTKDDLMVELAKHTANLALDFCQQRGAFTLVISGGSVPECLGKLLEHPYIDKVDWSKWHVFWVDERVVSKTSEDSNYLLAFNDFLSKVPIPAANLHAIDEEFAAKGEAEAAAACYEDHLKNLVKAKIVDQSISGTIPTEAQMGIDDPNCGIPKFDLMLLGMGGNGHFASLFPGDPLLEEKMKWVACINNCPKQPPKRITFTLPVINSSANVVFVVPEKDTEPKAPAVYTALMDITEIGVLPVELVKPQGQLMWYLDHQSASLLHSHIPTPTLFPQ